MNKIHIAVIIFTIFKFTTGVAQNYPVTELSFAFSIFSDREEKFNGYSVNLKYEAGITRRFSIVPGISIHNYEKEISYPIITTYQPGYNFSYYGQLKYKERKVLKLLSFPITANYFLLRKEKFSLAFTTGTTIQYIITNTNYFTYYKLNSNGIVDWGPYYGKYDGNRGHEDIIPDYFLFSAGFKGAKALSQKIGLSAHINYMVFFDEHLKNIRSIADFGLGVFIKTGKNFRKT